eukprot:XP_003730910.1 PREDICTED: craniofacial development protein 2-like [Strongylocentrotus purpuratus]
MESLNSTRVKAPDNTNQPFRPTGLQTAVHDDASSPNPVGRDHVDNPKEKTALLTAKKLIGIGTWNVRTLNQDGKLDILLNQLEKFKWEVIGVSETSHWKESGDFTEGGYKVLCASEEDVHRRGVALILNKQAQKALLGYNTISPRLISARFQTQTGALTIIQVYAPNMADREEMIDTFYDQLQQTIDDTPNKDILIVQGDLNAKVGRDWDTWKNVIGHHGYGEMNNRGEKLLNFCMANNLAIANTMFKQKKASREWTWESPDGRTKNKIDFVMVNNKWKSSVQCARSFPSADVASDHQLVICNFKLRFKTKPKQNVMKRYDVSKLKDENT